MDEPGNVTIDSRYDADSDGILGSDEVQCAVDCVDGDRYQEHEILWEAPPWLPAVGRRVPDQTPGGMIALDPSVSYRLSRPIALPLLCEGPLTVRGNGAVLRVVAWTHADWMIATNSPLLGGAVLERRVPRNGNDCDADWLADVGRMPGLVFENVVIRDERSAISAPEAAVLVKGITVHGSFSTAIRNCVFENLDVGVDLHYAISTSIERCRFLTCRRADIVVSDHPWCYDRAVSPEEQCFVPCDGTAPLRGPLAFPECYSPINNYASSASATIRGNRHVTRADADCVYRVHEARMLTMEHEIITGERPRSILEYRELTGQAQHIMRDVLTRLPADNALPLIHVSGHGTLTLDHIVMRDGGADPAADATDLAVRAETSVHCRLRNSVLSRGACFAIDGAGEPRLSFADVVGAPSPASPRRWIPPPGPMFGKFMSLIGTQGWLAPSMANNTSGVGIGALLSSQTSQSYLWAFADTGTYWGIEAIGNVSPLGSCP